MNIYDIAKEAGVSIATVSRVVNGKSSVSSKTREKVEAILKKFNYSPDPSARCLVVKSTKSVALLCEDVGNPFFGGICYEIERGLCKSGYTTQLYNTGGTAAGVTSSLKAALFQKVSAVIIAGTSSEANEEIADAAKQVPVVVINHFLDAPGVYQVVCDESYGMMLAVSRLVQRGRSNIIFVQDSGEEYSSTRELIEGFRGGMEMNELSPDDCIVRTERGFDGGYALADSLQKDGRRFNAAIFSDDTTATGFIKCLRQYYIDVPDDVSVVSFHNTSVAACSTPTITSVDCRSDKTGAAAVKILKQFFENGEAENKSVVLPRLVLRESA